ncbi:exonuclease SbcCD subunit D [Aestuariicella hydrocarbonica]|uniref:Nuclease SbcCD subunit D n=1 Tax=Pseudomaricurvus hydrocarbonicus TaxID=1470433 RepID=A0A9E5MMC1_9GAMM|nr:exonuclease SbcCD subunit D [Aestuariicella hydrocarbonica]NHO66878.1 exonuclease SbcCD subunit D [Aestuariicella hydrocarbonica]
MKFIHTSDWHIGRQFHNVSLLEDQRHVLDQLLAYMTEEAVDALVIAGDIYDRSIPPAAAVELLDDLLTRICMEMQIPVILIPGNHDSAQRLRFGSRQLGQSGLHILGDLNKVKEPVVIRHADGDVAFYGMPYNDPETVRNLFDEPVSTYDEAHSFLVQQILSCTSSEMSNVLASHCFIDGAEESESERPLSIGGSDRVSYQPCVPFDYVALGHLHSPQYKGKEHIRYSGSLLKYSFSEQHQNKGVTLVDLNRNGLQSVTHLPLSPLRNMRVLEGELTTLLEQGKTDPHNEDYLLVRLTDRHAILDPMSKLRAVYPNVLQLEKPGMLATGEQQMSRDKLKRNELDMFCDFFVQVSGQELTADQLAAIQQTIAEIHQQEQNS